MIYEIIDYQDQPEFWKLREVTQPPFSPGPDILVDLAVGSELDEIIYNTCGPQLNAEAFEKYQKWARSLIGRSVQIDKLQPLTAIANGIKLLDT